jgi:hypothetical protein
MIEELRDIERELNRLRVRVQRMINLLEKRRIRLEALSDDEIIGETAERTLPATDIAELLESAPPKKPRDKP